MPTPRCLPASSPCPDAARHPPRSRGCAHRYWRRCWSSPSCRHSCSGTGCSPGCARHTQTPMHCCVCHATAHQHPVAWFFPAAHRQTRSARPVARCWVKTVPSNPACAAHAPHPRTNPNRCRQCRADSGRNRWVMCHDGPARRWNWACPSSRQCCADRPRLPDPCARPQSRAAPLPRSSCPRQTRQDCASVRPAPTVWRHTSPAPSRCANDADCAVHRHLPSARSYAIPNPQRCVHRW